MTDLTPEQRSLVDLVLHGDPWDEHDTSGPPPICCLTGGPGTGKTHTIRTLCQELQRQGRSVSLAAPSGKAAQRLEQATGRPAATLHRLLKLRPEAPGAPATPVTSNVLVVDESSMIDVELMAQLVRACFGACGLVRTLVLVGDADQLPPVGPGEPFGDLVASSAVPTVRLTQIQRQAEGSGIVAAAHAVRAGKAPRWAPDLTLVESPEASAIPALVADLIARQGLDPRVSQVLAAQRTHACGVEALNEHLERARPDAAARGPLLRGKFRPGTKVIATKNDYTLGVWNGEIGTVLTADGQPGKERDHEIAVRFDRAHDEGAPVVFRGAAIKHLAPAWALTVHRSQGSEWEHVIVVAHPTHQWMLTRSLLYVALTRARTRCWVVGTAGAVEKAVRTVRDTGRRTMLKRWLRELAEQRKQGAGA